MSFFDALSDGIRSAYCAALGTSEAFWSSVAEGQNLGNVGPFPIDPAFVIANGLGIGAGLFCNNEPVPPPPPPFTGGQCSGVLYTFGYDAVSNGGIPFSRDNQGSLLGPIVGFELRTDDLFAVNEAGGDTQIGSGIASFSNPRVSRLDSLPDDCGDPPFVLPPTPPEVIDGIPQDIIFVDNDSNNITIPTTLFFGNVVINANLDATIPVRVEFSPEISLNANINLTNNSIDFQIGGGSGADETGCPPIPDDSLPDPPEEEENTLPRIVAVRVVTTGDPRNSGLLEVPQAGGNPTVIGRDAGLVSFLCPSNASGGGQAWTADIPVKTFNQIIPCPIPWGAIRVRGTARPGLTQSLTAIRSAIALATFPGE